jgi:Ca-activated chloride channel family protein
MYSPVFRFPRLLVAALLALFAALTSAHAQRMELSDSSASAVTVESVEIKTEVTGRIAVTTYDLVFRNPNDRILEGTFVFPLLDGQSIVRFGLDINGVLREAVPVDKIKGRIVFEEIERRRVDPGLLEQTAGNNYRARIFPIPARGTRRIMIAYQEDILRGTGEAAYRLNLDFPQRLKTFRLAVSAFAEGATAQARTTLGLTLPAWRDGKFMDLERSNFDAHGLLEISLPPTRHPRVLTGRHGDKSYFYAEAAVGVTARPRPAPKVVGLLWDSSGSARERDHAKEFALLDAWFAALANVEVRLIRLRDEAEPARSFTVRQGNWKTLRRELDLTDYDGATSLDGLKDDPTVDEWVLFSDGLINFSVTPATAHLALHGPVHTVLASVSADPSWLRGVSARHEGEFVNLLELTAPAASTRLRSQAPRVLRVESSPREVAEVFPERGTPLSTGPLVVTGILRGEQATVRLSIGTSTADAETVELVVHAGENPSTLAARGWAVAKIGHLSVNRTAHRADIRRTSRDFGIVTADTSLIVLETLNDYARYEIEPPAELQSEWANFQRNRRAPVADNAQKFYDQHLENVVRAFNERIAWWEKPHPKHTPEVLPNLPVYPRTSLAPRFMLPTWVNLAPSGNPGTEGTSTLADAARAAGGNDVVRLEAFVVTTERESFSTARSSQRLSASTAQAPSTGGRTRSPAAARAAPAISTSDPSAIVLQPWSPYSAYLERIERASDSYQAYLEEREDHARQPGFFLDVANLFFENKEPALARRILSNLAELQLEDVALLRVLAHRLVQAERPDLALPLFERVLALRPDEPQSRRDLALACADVKQYQRAIDLLWEIASQTWSDRFPEVEIIALNELNAIAATCGEELDLSRVDARLRRNLPVQTRIVVTWDTNDCDIDLWVTDPNGEKAIYNHPRTFQGGLISCDFTGGYGPEEFLLRDPKPGKYRAKINYYGDGRQTAFGPVTAQIRLITGFGTAAQTEKRSTLRLENRNQTVDAGTFVIANPVAKLPLKPAPGD